jgi:hypothetical protein
VAVARKIPTVRDGEKEPSGPTLAAQVANLSVSEGRPILYNPPEIL